MNKQQIGPNLTRRAADFAVLLVGFGLVAFGLIAFGLSGKAKEASRWWWIAYPVLLQVLLLAWVGRMPEHRGRFTSALRVVNDLMVNTFGRVVITGALAIGAGLAVAYLGHGMEPSPGLQELLDKARRSLPFVLVSAPMMMSFVTLWYLHALRSRGLVLADLATAEHRKLAAAIPGSLANVSQRLEHHMHTLASDSGAGMPWSIYGKRPTVTRTLMNDHVVQFECVWTWCPVSVTLSVRDDGAGGTMLRAHCQLRGGYYRIELVMNTYEGVLLLSHLQSNVVQLLQSEFALSEAKQHQDGLRRQTLEMQLRMLQAQIEPHFFFNTLANLRQLYRTDANAGEQMMDHLISYLRGAMDDLRSDASTIGKEFDLASHYLAIMKVRMGDRLSYSFVNHDDVSAHAFPPAMFISLVENAIKHGLRDKADGHLQITAARDGDTVRVSVLDNGPGFSSVEGTGVGLSNIRQRLEAMYGNRAWLEVGAPSEGGFIATIVVPA